MLLVSLHLVGDLCGQGRGTFCVRGRYLWVLGYNITPRVLLLFLGEPGFVVDPRLGGSDVHLGDVLLETLHSDGVGLLVLVGGTRADVVVPRLGELDVHLGVVLHECLHYGGVVLLVLHGVRHMRGVHLLGAETFLVTLNLSTTSSFLSCLIATSS